MGFEALYMTGFGTVASHLGLPDATGRQQVRDALIAGRAKLCDRMLVDMDEAAIVANARQWRERIAGVERA